jgi:hypothetical protein
MRKEWLTTYCVYSFLKISDWQRGVVVRANSHNATFHVRYDDGQSEFSVHSCWCIQPYTPYAHEEIVFLQKEDLGAFQLAQITQVYPPQGEFYDLYTKEDGGWHQKVPPRRIKRTYEMFPPGMQVEIFINDGETQGWLSGVVEHFNDEATFRVHYDPGYVDDKVSVENLRLPLAREKLAKPKWLTTMSEHRKKEIPLRLGSFRL